MNINWKQPAMDAAIAVGGGTIVKTFVIEKFATINNLFANIQMDLLGIDIKLLVAGVAALIAFKTWIVK